MEVCFEIEEAENLFFREDILQVNQKKKGKAAPKPKAKKGGKGKGDEEEVEEEKKLPHTLVSLTLLDADRTVVESKVIPTNASPSFKFKHVLKWEEEKKEVCTEYLLGGLWFGVMV